MVNAVCMELCQKKDICGKRLGYLNETQLVVV